MTTADGAEPGEPGPRRDSDDEPPFIQIRGVSKRFGNFVAVDDIDLDIVRGELFSILGGSGCGKTTLLRIMAGFEMPSAGRVIIDGVDITETPPYLRPVNMMFQSYALFPHMNVARNVSYGLRKEKLPANEIDERVTAILELVQLQDFAKRMPGQLSGGQRQRVALARALVKRPKVLLLDEPLAALDKKLREHTQFELANIQDELGITFVVVTHDQEEAMTLSSRIAVMDSGRLMQVGTPAEIYEYPNSRFVADFIGTINQFDGTIVPGEDGEARLSVGGSGELLSVDCANPPAPGSSACIAVRPEKIYISKEPPEGPNATVMSGVIEDLGYFGNLSLYQVRIDSGKIVLVSSQNRRRSAKRSLEWEDNVYISWERTNALLLSN